LLLASTFGAAELETPKGMALPHAFHSTNLEDGVVLRVEQGHFFIGRKQVTLEHLVENLEQEKSKSDFMIIQSDKSTRFSQLNPAVLAGLQSGFKQVRFAVLQEDEK
jgi:biopolymer transport protein ExbD